MDGVFEMEKISHNVLVKDIKEGRFLIDVNTIGGDRIKKVITPEIRAELRKEESIFSRYNRFVWDEKFRQNMIENYYERQDSLKKQLNKYEKQYEKQTLADKVRHYEMLLASERILRQNMKKENELKKLERDLNKRIKNFEKLQQVKSEHTSEPNNNLKRTI